MIVTWCKSCGVAVHWEGDFVEDTTAVYRCSKAHATAYWPEATAACTLASPAGHDNDVLGTMVQARREGRI